MLTSLSISVIESGVKVHVPYCLFLILDCSNLISDKHYKNESMEFIPIVSSFASTSPSRSLSPPVVRMSSMRSANDGMAYKRSEQTRK